MNGVHRVEIKRDGYTKVYVDGVEVRRVREVTFHESVEEAPMVTITLLGDVDISVDAIVEIENGEYEDDREGNTDQ